MKNYSSVKEIHQELDTLSHENGIKKMMNISNIINKLVIIDTATMLRISLST
ncbi:MAG TPA: hypothetical protein PKZ69_00455 [Candidatus Cloacimonadota bacterium]|nr:hypothetical protein [Candidatus Cloacimonadota bacterium]